MFRSLASFPAPEQLPGCSDVTLAVYARDLWLRIQQATPIADLESQTRLALVLDEIHRRQRTPPAPSQQQPRPPVLPRPHYA